MIQIVIYARHQAVQSLVDWHVICLYIALYNEYIDEFKCIQPDEMHWRGCKKPVLCLKSFCSKAITGLLHCR